MASRHRRALLWLSRATVLTLTLTLTLTQANRRRRALLCL